MAEAAPLRSGDPEQIGPYRLAGRLGEGGQGTVFLAEDASGTQVAVKLLHARLTGDAKARSRFAAELKVAQRVAAFCTARVLDADVEGENPYIVSEFIGGPSLQAVVANEGPRTGHQMFRLAIGTMTALAAIHDAGVVHRDLKPSNVLVAPDGPRLIDFGVARALDATGTMSSTAVGTPAYMAPEQISGHQVGPEADVFAWGGAMIYAATGGPPFGADSIPAVMHRILNFPPDLGALPEPLRDIVAMCLAKDPARRPSSQTVLLQLLHHAGALPASLTQAGVRSDTLLHHGAEVAASATPPPQPWAPIPPPGPAPYGFTPVVHKSPPRRRGLGMLAGAAAAAMVALIVLGAFVVPRFLDDSGGSGNGSTVRTGGELTMALYTTEGIDPSNAGWGSGRTLVRQLFTGLVEVTPQGTLRNRLAAQIRMEDGCGRWVIVLRPGTRFSNGEEVTGRSLVRGWSRALGAEDAAAADLLMSDIEGYAQASNDGGSFEDAVQVDGDTVTVRLTKPDCEFPKRLADPVFFPVPGSAGAADNSAYNTRPIGNGPFRLESYRPNGEAVLVRNDDWAFGKARLDRVTMRFFPDLQAMSAAARAGDVDWAEVGVDTVAAARTVENHQLLVRPSDGMQFLVPITARGPMAKREARQAVSLALDRTQLSSTLTGGAYRPATGLVPSAISGYAQGGRCAVCVERPDAGRAKELAQQAGLGPGSEVDIVVRDTSSYQKLAEAARAQLNSVLGWQVQVRSLPVGDYYEDLAGDDLTGLVAMGWLPDFPSAYSFLHPLLGGDQHPDAGSNYGRWRNTTFDRLLETARTTPDEQQATSLLKAAEQTAAEDAALIPVLNLAHIRLASKRFIGLEMDYSGDPTLATASLR